MNQIVLTGRMTEDAKIKKIEGDKPFDVAEFSIACAAYQGKGKDDKVSFFNCNAAGHSATFISKYCNKGDKILISGAIEQQRWEKDGVKRDKVVIKINTVELVSKKKSDGETNGNFADSNIPF